MATQIYPGVIVPDRLQTEQFLKSRAHQFLSTYSDVRYANWQTALNIASTTYKLSMDEYKAKLKALTEIDDAASRSLIAMDKEISKLKDDYTTTDEKQVQAAANAQGAADRFNAGQTNAMKRAQYNAQAAASRVAAYKSGSEATIPENVRQAAETAVGQTGATGLGDRISQYESSSVVTGQEAGIKSANRTAAAPIIFRGYDLSTTNGLDSAISQIQSSGLSPSQQGVYINLARQESARLKGTASGPSVPGAPGVAGVRATAPNFDEQQAIKLRRLHEIGGFAAVRPLLPPDVTEEQFLKDFGLEQTSGLIGELKAEQAKIERPTAPSGDLLGEARRIYSEGFEQNPYMKRRQAVVDTVGSLVSNYESKGMTPEEARNKAFDDLINFEKNQAAKGGTAVGNVASGFGDPAASNPLSYQGYGRGQPVGVAVGGAAAAAKPAEQQLPATSVPAPVDNSAFFGNAPDLGPSIRDELEQLLAARAARAARPPQAEAAPVAPAPVDPQQIPLAAEFGGTETGSAMRNAYRPAPSAAPVDPRMPNGRSAYAPGVGGLPAPSSYDYRGAGQVAQSAPTRSDLENDARVTNRGATPSMTARGQAPAFPVAPPQTAQPAPSVAPRPLAPKTGSPLLPMARGESAAGSISTTGTQPPTATGSISMTVERALELGNPFIVHSVGEGPRLSYIYDPGTKSFTLESKDGLPQDQPPIKEGDPRWNELMNPDLYEARPMPPATVPAAPPAGPPRAGGGSPRQPSAKQPPAVNSEEQRLMELLVTGTELADKPMKLNRLLNNTPAGKLVTQLMAANKKARTSQTFLDLREEIYRAYKGKPQQIELAIELLAASFIRETKSAAEKAQTTETN